jgi:MFS family permease
LLKSEQGFLFNMNPSQPTLLSSLRALPRPAWILYLGTFINKFGTFVLPFLVLYLTRQGYTLTQTGLAVGAYGVGNLAASLLGGQLADQIGRRKTIVLSMFSGAAALLLLSQAHSLPAIIALSAFTGLVGECYRPACSALLADLVPPHQRVTAFATYRVAINAGFAFGPATAGFLAAYGFFWLFAGDAATSVLFGLLAWFTLPGLTHQRSSETGWREALSALRRDRSLHQLLLANLAIALVFMQIFSTFGLHVTRLGFSAAVYGAIISLNGVLIVFCELPLTTITRRYPARRVLAAGYLLIATGFALNGFAHTIAALAGCMILFTLGEMVTMPVSAAYISNLAPPHLRGRYMGVSGLTWSLAFIIGPTLGIKTLAFHPAVFWIACAGLGILAAGIISASPSSHPDWPMLARTKPYSQRIAKN